MALTNDRSDEAPADGNATTCIAPIPPALSDDVTVRILERLVRMADYYCAHDGVRQAEEMYLQLLEDYPDSLQARHSRDRLLELCETYERAGQMHHARWLYEQLL